MQTGGRRSGSGGFTLIESMIAMFFLAYIVGAMGTIFVYASRNTNLSKKISRANALAEEAVERSRNTAYPNLQLAASYPDPIECLPPPSHPDFTTIAAMTLDDRLKNVSTETCQWDATLSTVRICTSNPSRWNCSNHGVAYTRVRTVSPHDREGNPIALESSNRSEVDVVVSYTDARGARQAIRVASVVSRY